MEKTKPVVMLCDELIKPFELTLSEYTNIMNDILLIEKDYLIKSIFVYIFSLFEVTLNNSLEYYLNCIPAKLKTNNGEFKIQKDALIENSMMCDLVEYIVEEHVISISYKNLDEYMKIYCDTFNINSNDGELLEKLKEKKASRNLLLHNNLVVNRKYLQTAGKHKRADKTGIKLRINKEYILETINLLMSILKDLESTLTSKYGEYTKLKALRDTWNYMFESPMLVFNNYWVVKDGKVIGFNENEAKKYISSLSSSEKTMLSIWIQHFSGSINDRYFKFTDVRMWTGLEEDVSFFIDILNRYPHIFQG